MVHDRATNIQTSFLKKQWECWLFWGINNFFNILLLLKFTISKWTFVKALKNPTRNERQFRNLFHLLLPITCFCLFCYEDCGDVHFWVNPEVTASFSAYFQTVSANELFIGLYSQMSFFFFCKKTCYALFWLTVPEVLCFILSVSQFFF